MLDKDQRDSLARLLHAMRPDWNYPGILSALNACDPFDPQDTIRAALAAAGDDNVKTPGVIPKPGSHWDPPAARQRQTGTRIRRPPRREQECKQHPGEWADACRGCAADRIGKR